VLYSCDPALAKKLVELRPFDSEAVEGLFNCEEGLVLHISDSLFRMNTLVFINIQRMQN
jgi:hypothetical protein